VALRLLKIPARKVLCKTPKNTNLLLPCRTRNVYLSTLFSPSARESGVDNSFDFCCHSSLLLSFNFQTAIIFTSTLQTQFSADVIAFSKRENEAGGRETTKGGL
jgi:hypothetical protein